MEHGEESNGPLMTFNVKISKGRARSRENICFLFKYDNRHLNRYKTITHGAYPFSVFTPCVSHGWVRGRARAFPCVCARYQACRYGRWARGCVSTHALHHIGCAAELGK